MGFVQREFAAESPVRSGFSGDSSWQTVFLLASCFGLLGDLQELRLGSLILRVTEDPEKPGASRRHDRRELRRLRHRSRRRDILRQLHGIIHDPAGARVRRLDDRRGRQEPGWHDRDHRHGGRTGLDRHHAGDRHRHGSRDRPWYPRARRELGSRGRAERRRSQSQLVPSEGSPIDLAFTMPSPGHASFSDGTIPNGYYTLVVKLLDNGQLVGGAVDVVRIVADSTTSGSITFTKVNTGTGSISVSVTLQMNAPIPVTMSGHDAELGHGPSDDRHRFRSRRTRQRDVCLVPQRRLRGHRLEHHAERRREPVESENLPAGRMRLRRERIARGSATCTFDSRSSDNAGDARVGPQHRDRPGGVPDVRRDCERGVRRADRGRVSRRPARSRTCWPGIRTTSPSRPATPQARRAPSRTR